MGPMKISMKAKAKAKAPGKKVIQVAATKAPQPPKAPPPQSTLDKKDIRDLLGHLRYHGGLDKTKKPKSADPQARAVLTAYHNGDSDVKAAMLEKWKGPGGKKLGWATDFIEKETEETVEEEEFLEKEFTMAQILQMNGVDPAHLQETMHTMILIRSPACNYRETL